MVEESASTNTKLLARFLFISYLTVRFLFNQHLVAFSDYAPFIFDAVFIIAVSLIYRKSIPYLVFFKKTSVIECALIFVSGMLTASLAQNQQMLIPIDRNVAEHLWMLLLVAPIIEEMLFRQAMGQIFQRIFNRQIYLIIATSLLFALSHYSSQNLHYPPLRTFIIYQTSYTFILGFWLGFRYVKTQSIIYSIILHFLFNLGFLLALS